MQKLLNDPDAFVDEMLEGILAAHPAELVRAVDNERVVVRRDMPAKGRVGIMTGGGSGHLPLFLGYVGVGLASSAAIGNMFSSPSAKQMLAATTAVDGGAGVLYLLGNYGGDVMNASLAAEFAEAEGIPTRTVLGTDDVASAPRSEAARRRGVAGILFQYKVAGASAERGDDLATVAELAARAGRATSTMSVGLNPCILPAVGEPTFTIEPGAMEVGVGLHGEPGVRTAPLESADDVSDQLYEAVHDDLGLDAGDEVAVLVNGLGSTPREELYLLYRRVAQRLASDDIAVHRVWVGEYATSLEMAGASLSLLRLDDDLTALLDAPARSPFFTFEV